MDHSAQAAGTFHRLADVYREKFMDLHLYDESYAEFLGLLKPGRARVLDAACGPGNVARYLMSHRPELELLGIDLAPRMVELARAAVPLAQFAVHDCRQLSQLAQRFDGIICAFGLPYLAPAEAASLIQAASDALPPGGVFYLSTILGGGENSGFQRASNGDELYIHYHDVAEVMATLQPHGFTVVTERLLPSPSAANKKTTDLIVIAKKQADTVSSK